MADIIKSRRDTAENWRTANPTLAEGELGFETDTRGYKLGDGKTPWNSLMYYGGTNYYFEYGADNVPLIEHSLKHNCYIVRFKVGNYCLQPQNGGNEIIITLDSDISFNVFTGNILWANADKKRIQVTNLHTDAYRKELDNCVILLFNTGGVPYGELTSILCQTSFNESVRALFEKRGFVCKQGFTVDTLTDNGSVGMVDNLKALYSIISIKAFDYIKDDFEAKFVLALNFVSAGKDTLQVTLEIDGAYKDFKHVIDDDDDKAGIKTYRLKAGDNSSTVVYWTIDWGCYVGLDLRSTNCEVYLRNAFSDDYYRLRKELFKNTVGFLQKSEVNNYNSEFCIM